MKKDYFGGRVAETYDDAHDERFGPEYLEAETSFLADLAGDGPVLELGIGTGRVAVPLRKRGVKVHGIELSSDMADQLRVKPGAEDIGVTIGDFATAKAPGTYSLAYLVYNTINNLTTQDEQVACFRNVAEHLEPGGYFVIDVGVPSLLQLAPDQTIHPFTVTDDHLGFDEYDFVEQGMTSHHFFRDGENWQRRSIPFRYVWPSELDLMAQLAGMSLHQRWSGWNREPFTAQSRMHVSVWKKPEAN
ncbi:class I SAM-dependent DNA methyltransferase [Natronoglycomyces albus]|uniref:Class I SAM-dependent methyltransferase n=1 Tax=Natronoglycomyces albus TaxID=2811108 RepID=A0A895XSF8_9ACTN|nr:class I SAM-dependent methyltransferase [Natronoglycomyces albus]QSB05486.1 class I SAM-dependent methyltransferase [Natronoglycomyces albus]